MLAPTDVGRNFNCVTCKESVQKVRRCREDREDFTLEDDPAVFPIYIGKGGTGYGYCPAKATWDSNLKDLFELLLVSYETGNLLYDGGIAANPEWFITLLAWFIPTYDQIRFATKVKQVLGDGKSTASSKPKPSAGMVPSSGSVKRNTRR